MHSINVTELREHLPKYLSNVQKGDEIWVTVHGKPIARILPPLDQCGEAQAQLKALRKRCKIGDIISPIDEKWKVE